MSGLLNRVRDANNSDDRFTFSMYQFYVAINYTNQKSKIIC